MVAQVRLYGNNLEEMPELCFMPELKLIESLAQGKAIEHHLEPSYFVAMTKALDAAQSAGAELGEA